MSPDEIVRNWLELRGGRLRDRVNADECYAAVRRRYWIAEARDVLMANGFLGEPDEDLLEAVARELWSISVEECNRQDFS